jgi:non-lysosomal glucosylceramidase
VDDAHTPDSLQVDLSLAPGESRRVTFLLAWHFPNLSPLPGLGRRRPAYAARFDNAAAVARDTLARLDALRRATFAWTETWYDASLPRWLMDRSILTANTLQTSTCYLLDDGRFWAWEGIGCCPGTCNHVWHYAQSVARLFPQLERTLREVTDYGIALNPDGGIRYRGDSSGNHIAIDGQAGVILRTWREHLCSPDDAFLRRVWPAAKQALEWLIRFDENDRDGLDGLLDGNQPNTLDASWFGKVHCLCSLYLAALKAGQALAMEAGDAAFAARCGAIHAQGAHGIERLFNGEFYVQIEDPAHRGAIGVGQGCYIDQVIGQWWATQTGLGRLYREAHIHSALHALWKYNFVPETGRFRRTFATGRFYALGDEAGLIMCSWPNGGLREDFMRHWQYGYFNECMTGFEYQAAGHMIMEGAPVRDTDGQLEVAIEDPMDPRSLTLRGLAVGRAIHDRYAPARRNPYNEIECSDHYARAAAGFSLFTAATGFDYHGPKGELGFAPKLTPGTVPRAVHCR